MPIEAPSNTPIGSRTHSEFVLCEGFAFRPSNVDGCSHQAYADGSAVTIVNFKPYTQTIPRLRAKAIRFSDSQTQPKPADESDDFLLYLLCIVGALVGYLFLAPPLSWCAIAACAASVVWTLLASERASATVLRFAGLCWSMEDFVRGWLITGRTGSGKTHCAVNTITYQVFQNVPIGSDRLSRPTRLPLTTLERAVISELHRFFRPELIGRFDEKIVFKPLSHDMQREIGGLAISGELERFRARGFNLTVSEAAFEFLIRRGIQKTLGARPIKKTVKNLSETPYANH